MFHGSRKGFSGGSQKIIGPIGAARSAAEGASLGEPAPVGVQGGKAPEIF